MPTQFLTRSFTIPTVSSSPNGKVCARTSAGSKEGLTALFCLGLKPRLGSAADFAAKRSKSALRSQRGLGGQIRISTSNQKIIFIINNKTLRCVYEKQLLIER